MKRREFLKGLAAAAGMAVLPGLIFTTKIRKIIFDSGHQPAYGRLKIYSDMTWKRYVWLGFGWLETGVIEKGRFIILNKESLHHDNINGILTKYCC